MKSGRLPLWNTFVQRASAQLYIAVFPDSRLPSACAKQRESLSVGGILLTPPPHVVRHTQLEQREDA